MIRPLTALAVLLLLSQGAPALAASPSPTHATRHSRHAHSARHATRRHATRSGVSKTRHHAKTHARSRKHAARTR
jgi:hypothetical protein